MNARHLFIRPFICKAKDYSPGLLLQAWLYAGIAEWAAQKNKKLAAYSQPATKHPILIVSPAAK